MIESVDMIKPILALNTLAMVLFTMAICFTKDITSSKPWVGFAGVFSTMMATFAGNTISGIIILYPGTFAAYGSLVYLGAYFTNFNYGAIFVLIGVGESDIDYIVD